MIKLSLAKRGGGEFSLDLHARSRCYVRWLENMCDYSWNSKAWMVCFSCFDSLLVVGAVFFLDECTHFFVLVPTSWRVFALFFAAVFSASEIRRKYSTISLCVSI